VSKTAHRVDAFDSTRDIKKGTAVARRTVTHKIRVQHASEVAPAELSRLPDPRADTHTSAPGWLNLVSGGLTTAQLAAHLNLKPQTLRKRSSQTGSYFGVMASKLENGRLLWPADSVEKLLKMPARCSKTLRERQDGESDAHNFASLRSERVSG